LTIRFFFNIVVSSGEKLVKVGENKGCFREQRNSIWIAKAGSRYPRGIGTC
jgi:hypothetical protein